MPVKLHGDDQKQHGLRDNRKAIGSKGISIAELTKRNILEKFTEEQISEFRSIFDMFDKDSEGHLTPLTLISVMKTVGYTASESDILDLMREMDSDNSGTIDFFEFIHTISHKMSPNETSHDVRHAFNLFDQDHDGLISLLDLKLTVEKYMKSSITESQLHQMIELTDGNDDNHVSFEDFLRAAICRSDKRSSIDIHKS